MFGVRGGVAVIIGAINKNQIASVKKTGEATYDLSNSAMGTQLLSAIEDKQALSVVLHAIAKESNTQEALAAATAQDVRVESAKRLTTSSNRNRAKGDAKHEVETRS